MIFQPVIVADPLNPVVVNVQPFKALWDEGKVEPLRTIKSEMMGRELKTKKLKSLMGQE